MLVEYERALHDDGSRVFWIFRDLEASFSERAAVLFAAGWKFSHGKARRGHDAKGSLLVARSKVRGELHRLRSFHERRKLRSKRAALRNGNHEIAELLPRDPFGARLVFHDGTAPRKVALKVDRFVYLNGGKPTGHEVALHIGMPRIGLGKIGAQPEGSIA